MTLLVLRTSLLDDVQRERFFFEHSRGSEEGASSDAAELSSNLSGQWVLSIVRDETGRGELLVTCIEMSNGLVNHPVADYM